MLKIIICDDEKCCIEELKKNIIEASKVKLIEIEIMEFSSGTKLLSAREDWINTVDVIFMDVKLETENGIEVASLIREQGFTGEIVFLTSSKEFVFQSFAAKPLNYLIKNEMHFENFRTEFDNIITAVGSHKHKIFSYNVGKEKFLVPLKRIVFFEIKKRIVYMCFLNNEGEFKYIEFYSSLESVEKKIGDTLFLKPHRSYLINPIFIKKIGVSDIDLENGERISISRKFKDELVNNFNEYLELSGIELK